MSEQQVVAPLPREVVGLLGLVDKRYRLAAEASLARKAIMKTVQKHVREAREIGVSTGQINAMIERLISEPSTETAKAIVAARAKRAEIMAAAKKETDSERARLKELGSKIKALDADIFKDLNKPEIRRLLE
ncbi:MAG: hypothetical protein ACP5RJ_06785 [Conexivisphaera sp.]